MNMKMKSIASLFAMVLTGTAFAANNGGPLSPASGGYTGPNAERITTVTQAKDASDDAHVILEGYITERLQGDERYEFKDSTGLITVEVDDDDWPMQSVDDKTRVRLYGEVDKSMFNTEIDVDYLEIVK